MIERTHAWGNQYGKLRWCTERRRLVVEFWLALAGALIVCGRLIRRAWTHYRWQDRHDDAHDHCWRSLYKPTVDRQRPDLAIPVGPGITAPGTKP